MPHGEIPEKADYAGVVATRHAFSLERLQASRAAGHAWKWSEIMGQIRKDNAVRIEQGLEPVWAVIARYDKGTTKERDRRRDLDKKALLAYLRRVFPLERWSFRYRTIPGSWYVRQMEARFEGFMTVDEYHVHRAIQREKMQFLIQLKTAKANERKVREQAGRVAEAEELRQAAMRARQANEG